MKRIIYIIAILFQMFIYFPNTNVNVNAEVQTNTVKGYSSVIDDLNQFDIDLTTINYEDDVSFIHFTQKFNVDNELLTFIYLSTNDSTTNIKQINLSTSLDKNDENFKLYNLTLVSYNANEKLRKYEINGLNNNQNEMTRRYALASIIFEKADESKAKTLNTQYYFHGKNNEELEGYVQDLKTITITDKEIFVYCYGEKNDSLIIDLFGKYATSYKRNTTYADAWYLFFNTEEAIDELLEIEIDYGSFEYVLPVTTGNNKTDDLITLQKANELVANPGISYLNYKDKLKVVEKEHQQVTITPGTTIVESTNPGWFGKYEYHYETLDKIVDLKKQTNSGSFVFANQVEKYQFAVNFLNSERKVEDVIQSMDNVPWLLKGISTNDICILRLKFLRNGKLYNLGAVDVPKDPTGSISVEPYESNFILIILKIGLLILGVIVLFKFIIPVVVEFINTVFGIKDGKSKKV